MTDYIAEAESAYVDAVHAKTGTDIENSRQLQALVAATIAVAKQQRIANRIALANMTHADGSRIGSVGGMETAIFNYGERESSVVLKPEIRDGLGL